MRVNADLRLKDIPGQLILALEPISANNGNIVGVIHNHDKVVGGRISVNVTFEVRNQDSLDGIFQIWKENGVEVAKMGHQIKTFTSEYLLVGELTQTTLKSLTDGIEKIGNVDSIDFRYSLSTMTSHKSVLMIVKLTEQERILDVDRYLQDRSETAGFLLIRGMGD